MGVNPPPGTGNTIDTILGLYMPTFVLFLVVTILSASFVLGVSAVKTIGSFILCGVSMFFLFLEAKDKGCTGTKWNFAPKDWAQLALTVHALYFGLIHGFVSK